MTETMGEGQKEENSNEEAGSQQKEPKKADQQHPCKYCGKEFDTLQEAEKHEEKCPSKSTKAEDKEEEMEEIDTSIFSEILSEIESEKGESEDAIRGRGGDAKEKAFEDKETALDLEKSSDEEDRSLKEKLEEDIYSEERDRLNKDRERILSEVQERERSFREEMKKELEWLQSQRNKLQEQWDELQTMQARVRAGMEAGPAEISKSSEEPGEIGEIEDEIVKKAHEETEPSEVAVEGVSPNMELDEEFIRHLDEKLERISQDLYSIREEVQNKADTSRLDRMNERQVAIVRNVERIINSLNQKLDIALQTLGERRSKKGARLGYHKEFHKLDEKVTDILEEIGFGESMNVGKIPPNILESVYNSTIEDVVNVIRRNYGSHDAENLILQSLEDIRTKTSGSELFTYDGRKLRTRNLAKALGQKLISAKQVQTTYDELLHKLLEYVPTHKPKNFRAMIKLKSQEYAVDTSTSLLDRYNILRNEVTHTGNLVNALSNAQFSIKDELSRKLDNKADLEKFTEMEKNLAEIREKLENDEKQMIEKLELLSDRLDRIIAQPEPLKVDKKAGKKKEKKKAPVKEKDEEKEVFTETETVEKALEKEEKEEKAEVEKVEEEVKELIPQATGVIVLGDDEGLPETPKIPILDEEEDFQMAKELSENELKIFELLPEKGYTAARIKKEIGDEMSDKEVEKALKDMMNKGYLTTVRRGRHTIYVTKKLDGGEFD